MNKKIRFFVKRSSKIQIQGKNQPIVIPFQLTSIFLLIVMVIVSAFLFLRSDLFQIKAIKISSEIPSCATEEGIKFESEAVGASVIFYDERTAAKKILEKFYCLENVKIIKNFPSTLEIKIFGRIPVAAISEIEIEPALAIATMSGIPVATDSAKNFATNSAFFAIDKNGVVFQNLGTSSALPKVYIANDLRLSSKVLKDDVLWLLDFLAVAADLNLNFSQVVKTTDGFFLLETQDGFQVILASGKDIGKTTSSLQAIFKQAKIEGANFKILDFRFEKPVLK